MPLQVYSAKRAAMLRGAEQDGMDTTKQSKRVKKAARGLMEDAPVGLPGTKKD